MRTTLNCYSSRTGPKGCKGNECKPVLTCEVHHNACLVREVSWENNDQEPELTYDCATMNSSYEYNVKKCCKDNIGRKDCRKYTKGEKSNTDKDFTGSGSLHGNWECLDLTTQPPIPTSITTTTTEDTTSLVTTTVWIFYAHLKVRHNM